MRLFFFAELSKSELFSGTFDYVKVGMFMLNDFECSSETRMFKWKLECITLNDAVIYVKRRRGLC